MFSAGGDVKRSSATALAQSGEKNTCTRVQAWYNFMSMVLGDRGPAALPESGRGLNGARQVMFSQKECA
jgi:hypothetical protein